MLVHVLFKIFHCLPKKTQVMQYFLWWSSQLSPHIWLFKSLKGKWKFFKAKNQIAPKLKRNNYIWILLFMHISLHWHRNMDICTKMELSNCLSKQKSDHASLSKQQWKGQKMEQMLANIFWSRYLAWHRELTRGINCDTLRSGP